MFTGIVEGFYGKPYSHSQRDILVDYLSGIPSPAYVYAPKNDRFHRLDWRLPYPPEEWKKLAATMSGASRRGVRFFFAVSPWQFRPDEKGLLSDRAHRALEAGASGIAVLFDDIPESATPDLASAQLRFASESLEGTGCDVVVCPSVYCLELLARLDGKAYLEEWRRSCPAEWGVFWTGDMVVSQEMDGGVVSRARDLLGREPVIWDNLLADDYCLRRSYFGDLHGRAGTGCPYLLNPSSVFPAALHAAMELSAAFGAGREWPGELGPRLPGWELLAEFHHLPWSAGRTGAELLHRLSEGFRGEGESAVREWLSESTASLSDLCSSLESVEGGLDLLPLVLDLRRFLSILGRCIIEADPRSRRDLLRHLLLERLPYEHPVALAALDLLHGDGGGKP